MNLLQSIMNLDGDGDETRVVSCHGAFSDYHFDFQARDDDDDEDEDDWEDDEDDDWDGGGIGRRPRQPACDSPVQRIRKDSLAAVA